MNLDIMFPETLLAIAIVISIYYYLIKNYNYWFLRKVPGPKPSIFFGNMMNSALLKKTLSENLNEIYQNYEGAPYVGIYQLRQPALLLRDPKLIKHILIKDFSYFQGRGLVFNEKEDPLSAHLIILSGPRWKIVRQKLTPGFTSNKMRQMFSLIEESAEKYQAFVKKYADTEDTIEFRDFASKFTLDVIGSCCFGIETNSIQEEDSEFHRICTSVAEPSYITGLRRGIRWFLPGIFKMFRMRMASDEVTKYFKNMVKNVITYREQKKIVRNDIMQLLMQLKNQVNDQNDEGTKNPKNDIENDNLLEKSTDIVFDETVIAAQAYAFLAGGFDVLSSAISFSMYEIACNPKIQDKLYDEIATTLRKYSSISYEAISEMEFLDRVVHECLRMHSPIELIVRTCNKPYQIPDTTVTIEKGIRILISIPAIHQDPQYYPNPQKFDPDRFLDKNNKLQNECPYLPFGNGPRVCIGRRFSYVVMKVYLVAILSKYKLTASPKTLIERDPTTNIVTTKYGIWLKVQHRKKN